MLYAFRQPLSLPFNHRTHLKYLCTIISVLSIAHICKTSFYLIKKHSYSTNAIHNYCYCRLTVNYYSY